MPPQLGTDVVPMRPQAWAAERVRLAGVAEVLDPRRVHLGVAPAPGDELVVRAELDDPAVVDDRDAIGAHRGRQPVGDDDRGAALEQRVEAGLDLRLRLEVEVRRRLVEHEDARSGEEGARQRDQLALARRQRHAALVDRRVDAVGQVLDELVEPDAAHGLHHLVVGGVGPGEGDVVAHGAREQERLLRHDAELAPQRLDGDVAQVVAVDRARCPRSGRRSA